MSEPQAGKRALTVRWACNDCGDIFDTEPEAFRCHAAHVAEERLRDAAPDLYEALRQMVNNGFRPEREDFVPSERGELGFAAASRLWQRALAALAKAEGK